MLSVYVGIQSLPEISAYTIIQDPGQVTVRVTGPGQLTTGVVTDGSVLTQIPASLYYPSATNPGVLLADPSPGTYSVSVTGVASGVFSLSASTTLLPNGAPSERGFSQTIQKGATLEYQFVLGSDQGGLAQGFTSRPDASVADLLEPGVRKLGAVSYSSRAMGRAHAYSIDPTMSDSPKHHSLGTPRDFDADVLCAVVEALRGVAA